MSSSTGSRPSQPQPLVDGDVPAGHCRTEIGPHHCAGLGSEGERGDRGDGVRGGEAHGDRGAAGCRGLERGLEGARVSGRLDDDGCLHPLICDLGRGVHRMCAQLGGPRQLLRVRVHADHTPQPQRQRCEQCGHAHAAQAHDHDVVPVCRLPRVEHGAAAGQHGTAQHGCDLRRHVRAHRHHGAAVEDGMGGEAGHAQVVVHGAGAEVRAGAGAGAVIRAGAGGTRARGAVQPHVPAHQRARIVHRAAGRAGQLAVGETGGALAAAGEEDGGDLLSRLQVRDVRAHLFDHSGGLVPQEHGYGARPVAVHHGEVGVAEAGGAHADEDLVRPGSIELQCLQLQRLGLRVGPGAADLCEHCAGDLHGFSSATLGEVPAVPPRAGPHDKAYRRAGRISSVQRRLPEHAAPHDPEHEAHHAHGAEQQSAEHASQHAEDAEHDALRARRAGRGAAFDGVGRVPPR
jgi:hypothetical protein